MNVKVRKRKKKCQLEIVLVGFNCKKNFVKFVHNVIIEEKYLILCTRRENYGIKFERIRIFRLF